MKNLIKFARVYHQKLGRLKRSVRLITILTLANLAPMSAEAKGHWRADDFTSIPLQRNKGNINSGIFDQPQTSSVPRGGSGNENSNDSSSGDFNKAKSIGKKEISDKFDEIKSDLYEGMYDSSREVLIASDGSILSIKYEHIKAKAQKHSII